MSHPHATAPASPAADDTRDTGPLAWLGVAILVALGMTVAAAAVHTWRPLAMGDGGGEPGAGVATASAGALPTPATATTGAIPAVDSITLTRGPCMGACPVYALTVRADGQVAFEGLRHTCQAGATTATLPAADARALLDAVRDAGLPTAPDYTHVDMTDAPTVHLATSFGENKHVVAHYLGMRDVPDKVAAIEARIDAIAQDHHWLPGRDGDKLVCADGRPLRDNR